LIVEISHDIPDGLPGAKGVRADKSETFEASMSPNILEGAKTQDKLPSAEASISWNDANESEIETTWSVMLMLPALGTDSVVIVELNYGSSVKLRQNPESRCWQLEF
jgi:hypothetical protein